MKIYSHIRTTLLTIVLILASTGCVVVPPSQMANATPAPEAQSDQTATEEGGIQPYEDVITDEVKTQDGLFKVHTVKEKLYFEIPANLMGVDMLWYAETSSVPPRVAAGRALGKRLVQWVRQGNKILVLDRTKALAIRNTSDGAPASEDGSAVGVEQVTRPSVIMAFDIAAEGAEDSVVIEVTHALARNIDEFTAISVLSQADYTVSPDPDFEQTTNFVHDIKSFKKNVEVRASLNFRLMPPEFNINNYEPVETSTSLEVRHSIVLLPKNPMRPRFADARVGYFGDSYADYSYQQEDRVAVRNLINRYRLEKREPNQAVSEPITPIVYYISPNVPAKWRNYIKQGVAAWQPALEAAGFKNAIVAKDAPTASEDPTWSEFDIQHSVIHWQFTEGGYAEAAGISDPRSGEILSSRIYITANMLEYETYAYFAQASALDPRTKTFPLPDEVVGSLLTFIISHEVGHTLGLAHNFKASQAYTVAQLRDPAFVKKNGITASVMSYSAYNFVAQPEDGLAPEQLLPNIGPYDVFAIKWGYAPILQAQASADEKPTLDNWASEQLTNPWLAYDGDYEIDDDSNDPTVLRFNLSSERLVAAQLGMKNLERSLNVLATAISKPGETNEPLANAYGMLLFFRASLLMDAATVPGGVVEQRALSKTNNAEYAAVPVKDQREAVQFVLENLQVPEKFLRPEISDRIQPSAIIEPLLSFQTFVLSQLMRPETYIALTDLEVRAASAGQSEISSTYPVAVYLSDIQNGIWSELNSPIENIHPMRRALQRFYLVILKMQLAEDSYTDLRGGARSNLRTLQEKINAALPNTANASAKAHLEDARDEIENILNNDAADSASSIAQAKAAYARFMKSNRHWFVLWQNQRQPVMQKRS